jgi:hypothetical protein
MSDDALSRLGLWLSHSDGGLFAREFTSMYGLNMLLSISALLLRMTLSNYALRWSEERRRWCGDFVFRWSLRGEKIMLGMSNIGVLKESPTQKELVKPQ